MTHDRLVLLSRKSRAGFASSPRQHRSRVDREPQRNGAGIYRPSRFARQRKTRKTTRKAASKNSVGLPAQFVMNGDEGRRGRDEDKAFIFVILKTFPAAS